MTVCIIPARGGSKRIPGKNKKNFFGKPMILWPLECAMNSGIFEEIVVSTDDKEIADIAFAAGASVPFLRPNHMADDHTDTVTVIKHAVQTMLEKAVPEYVCCIYPTAPLLRPEFLKNAFKLLKSSDVDYVVPVTEYPYPIQRALVMGDSHRIHMADKNAYEKRSQDLSIFFHDIGQFYWGRASSWVDGLPLLNSKSLGFRVSREFVVDIDTAEDWKIAENLFRLHMKDTGIRDNHE